MPTYFITRPEEEKHLPADIPPGGILAENLTYLGGCGIREVFGMQVGYFSGTRDPPQKPDFDETLLNALFSRSRLPSFSGIDILLTNHWSQGILSNLKDVTIAGLATTEQQTFGSETVSSLCEALTPRYHLSASPNHLAFERAPYSHELANRPTTRFVALAEVFNSRKAKFMYAFSIEPMVTLSREVLLQKPEGTTSSPFGFRRAALEAEKIESSKKRRFEHLEEADSKTGTQLFFDARRAQRGQEYHERTERMQSGSVKKDQTESNFHQDRKQAHHDRMRQQYPQDGNQGHSNRDHASNDGQAANERRNGHDKSKRGFDRNDPKMKQKIHPLMQRSGCWFCLSNPIVEEHLVVSVGDENYIAMAKGGLSPHHLLIIPIEHLNTLVSPEIDRFKEAIIQCYRAKDMEVVFWERKLDVNPNAPSEKHHAALQVLPIPKSLLNGVKTGFDTQLEHFGLLFLELEPTQSVETMVASSGYLYVDLPDIVEEPVQESEEGQKQEMTKKVNRKRLLAIIPDKKRVPLQLPRKVIAQAMNEPQREDWKSCVLSRDEEESTCASIKEDFAPYDFTLQN